MCSRGRKTTIIIKTTVYILTSNIYRTTQYNTVELQYWYSLWRPGETSTTGFGWSCDLSSYMDAVVSVFACKQHIQNSTFLHNISYCYIALFNCFTVSMCCSNPCTLYCSSTDINTPSWSFHFQLCPLTTSASWKIPCASTLLESTLGGTWALHAVRQYQPLGSVLHANLTKLA